MRRRRGWPATVVVGRGDATLVRDHRRTQKTKHPRRFCLGATWGRLDSRRIHYQMLCDISVHGEPAEKVPALPPEYESQPYTGGVTGGAETP